MRYNVDASRLNLIEDRYSKIIRLNFCCKNIQVARKKLNGRSMGMCLILRKLSLMVALKDCLENIYLEDYRLNFQVKLLFNINLKIYELLVE